MPTTPPMTQSQRATQPPTTGSGTVPPTEATSPTGKPSRVRAIKRTVTAADGSPVIPGEAVTPKDGPAR
jgi:hypothetical protein